MLNLNVKWLAAVMLTLFMSTWISAQDSQSNDENIMENSFIADMGMAFDDDDAMPMMGGPGMDFQFDRRGKGGPCIHPKAGFRYGRTRGPMGMIFRFADDLKLTEDQIDKIKSLYQTERKKNIALHSELELKRIELQELMDTAKPDKAKVEAKMKEIEAVRTKIHSNRLNLRIDVLEILTKEQRDQLEKIKLQCPMGCGQRYMKKFRNSGN